MNIIAYIVNYNDPNNEEILESQLFENVKNIFDKRISDWNYHKIFEYDSKYHFAEWEDLNVDIHTKYVDRDKNKIIRIDSMLGDYMGL